MNSNAENYDRIYINIEHLNHSYSFFRQHIPVGLSVSGIHRAVLEEDFCKVKQWIESGGSINEREGSHGFSALHLAVIKNDMKILDYLLIRYDLEVDAKCSRGRTPLYLASALGWIESAERLIQGGSDVNITDNEDFSPLHSSVYHPHICHLLVRHGALIDAVNTMDLTPLDIAANANCLETIHMLLYYNADVNTVDKYGCTPFMKTLYRGNVRAQEALIEYVDDFNTISYHPAHFGSILSKALISNSPFVKDVIERGADVNYRHDPTCPYNVYPFLACFRFGPVDLSTFKMVWERLQYNDTGNNIDLLRFLNYNEVVPTFLSVIIESDNFKPVVDYFFRRENYFLFVNKFAEKKYGFDQLTALTCRLLEYGFRATSYDVHMIFSHYGYCELFRILLYMDNDFIQGWLPSMTLCRLILDINCNMESIVDKINNISKEAVLQLLEFSICPRLIDVLILLYNYDESMSAVLGSLPRVPSLIELARNTARKQIWQAFQITSNCQFYTTIDRLDIAILYKDILRFKKKIYRVK